MIKREKGEKKVKSWSREEAESQKQKVCVCG
jgi:hypothetical protein